MNTTTNTNDAPRVMNAAQTQFRDALAAAYADLFVNDPEYSYSASKCTPMELANKMTAAAITGSANYTGKGMARASKACGIKHTARSVAAFLDPLRNAGELPAVCRLKG